MTRRDSEAALGDPMRARAIVARWVVRGALTLETAAHIGGPTTERVDMTVLRDARDGVPLLPGSTLAGALRAALSDRLAGYGEREPDEVAALFGGARGGDEEGSQSPLIVFDALGKLPSAHGVEIRDGVSISPATGTAEDKKKYDYEVLPAGTTFEARMDLLVADLATEKDVLNLLATALAACSDGDVSIGAKRSRGLGRLSARWTAERFALDDAPGWTRWLGTDHEAPVPGAPDEPCIRDVLSAKLPSGELPPSPTDRRKRVVIDAALDVAGDLLVRAPTADPGAPDVGHLSSAGHPILPGTGVAGVLRTQALRIAELMEAKTAAHRAADRVDALFGPRFEGQRPPAGTRPRVSRLRVNESTVDRAKPRVQTRVAIDRFTQAVVPTALFDEQVSAGGTTQLRLELRDPRPDELGLVLLALRDLLDGSLPVGGASSVGRGVLQGKAEVTVHDGTGNKPRSAVVEPNKEPEGEAAKELTEKIERLWQPTAPEPEGAAS